MEKIAVDVRRHPWAVTRCRVTLDGFPLTHCFAADEREGWAKVDLTDERGRMTGDSDRLRGVVEILPVGITREMLELLARS